jgi:hypothetical protein
MKNFTQLIVLFVVLFGASKFSLAQQNEMFLSKPTSQTFINEIINSDVDGSGNRLDSSRVYVLERGGVWFMNDKIENIGWPLKIKASDGNGPRPVIYNVVNKSGSITGDMIQGNGDVMLENLTITGLADYDPNAYNEQGFAGIVIVMESPGFNLILDGCVIVNSGSALLRTKAATEKVSIKNCIFGNYGQMPKKSTTNGRVIDLRDVSIDSLIMVNNTMVNGYDRVVRHASSTGAINNVVFDHNTIINNAGSFGVIGLGLVGEKVQISNNIFYDAMAFGADTNRYRQPDFKEMDEFYTEADKSDKLKMTWIYHQKQENPEVETEWVIANNYWDVSENLQAAFDNIKAKWNPGLEGIGRHMSDYIAGKISNPDKAFVKDKFNFSNAPADMSGMVTWHHKPISEGGAGGKDVGEGYVEYDKKTAVFYADTMDCSYQNTIDAYRGAKGGFPVGDLNWFPEIKKVWMESDTLIVTGVQSLGLNNSSFNLNQNYPNPFSNSTTIAFTLNASSNVQLSVVDIMGQTIKMLVDVKLNEGEHSIIFDASDLNSGIYFYSLKSGGKTITKRMIVAK